MPAQFYGSSLASASSISMLPSLNKSYQLVGDPIAYKLSYKALECLWGWVGIASTSLASSSIHYRSSLKLINAAFIFPALIKSGSRLIRESYAFKRTLSVKKWQREFEDKHQRRRITLTSVSVLNRSVKAATCLNKIQASELQTLSRLLPQLIGKGLFLTALGTGLLNVVKSGKQYRTYSRLASEHKVMQQMGMSHTRNNECFRLVAKLAKLAAVTLLTSASIFGLFVSPTTYLMISTTALALSIFQRSAKSIVTGHRGMDKSSISLVKKIH